MSFLSLRDVSKFYGSSCAVSAMNLSVEQGEFVSLLGPSGCGKTTTLQMVAGFEPVSSGTITLAGRDITQAKANTRGLGIVFQSYALFPHMTVADNVSFGLEMRKLPRAERQDRVRKALSLVHLEPHAQRYPRELSGGQRQRVAMGRAIVRDPKVFLFDEPLSNLDAKLRVQMRTEIKRLRERVATTTVYVTHDQVEAMTLADRIVILNGGRIEQIGTPEDVYDRPASTFVAGFIGAPPMNLLPASALPAAGRPSEELLLGVRPEHLVWHDGGTPLLQGTASVVEPLGSDTLVSLDVGGTAVVARLPPRVVRRKGEAVRLAADPANLHFFDKSTGLRQAM